MQRRYRHFLTPVSRVPRPGLVVCVGVSSRTEETETTKVWRTEYLETWEAVVLRRWRVVYRETARASGRDYLSFWEWIERTFSNGRNLTIISHHCTRVWSLLRLWECIENGLFTIGESEQSRRQGSDKALPDVRPENGTGDGTVERTDLPRLPNNGGGFCILEDPPSIIRGALCPTGTTVNWWDVRNWGVGPGGVSGASQWDACQVATWFSLLTASANAIGAGPPTSTAASWAYRTYRQLHYTGGMYMHNNKDVLDLESSAYYGGRCECFRMGRMPEPGVMLDVRGAYVNACECESLPVRFVGVSGEPTDPQTLTMERCLSSIAIVRVETPTNLLPYRSGKDIVYPVGSFWTALAGPELAQAYHAKAIRNVSAMATYQMAPALSRWAGSMDKLRRSAESLGNTAAAASWKAAGVGLVGKLAQRVRGWESSPSGHGRMLYGEAWGAMPNGDPALFRWVSGHCFRAITGGWTRDSNVAMAAFITASARVRLFGIMCVAGMENVWYCDTDSVVVNMEGYGRLLHSGMPFGKTLGALSVRHGPGDVEIWGIKHYRIGNHVVCAGTPKGVVTEGPDALHRWHTQAASDQVRGKHRPAPDARLLSMPKPESYRHGTVNSDGTVSPLVVADD